MRIITTILFIFFASNYLIAQQNMGYYQYPETNGDVVFEKVNSFDSVSSNVLYKYVKSFFINNTGNSNYSIQLDDSADGTLIGIGSFPNLDTMVDGYALMGDWYFKIRFDVRENKVRVRFYDIEKRVRGAAMPLTETIKVYKEEILNKTKRANALSQEGIHVNKVISNYLVALVRHVRKELTDSF